MLNVDRAWQRAAHHYPNKKLSDFRFMAIGQNFTLTSALVSGLTRVDFAAGSLILGVTAYATTTGAASTQAYRDSGQLFSASIDYPNSEALTTGGRLLAGTIFGTAQRCEFPVKEIRIETNGSLSYTLENLSTSTIIVSIVHYCLVPRGIT